MESVFQLKPEAVAFGNVTDKSEALARISLIFASAYALDAGQVQEALEEREALGSTGFGHGVAIPHARMPGLIWPIGAVLKLDAPINFAAADAMPVELVFGLLSPVDCGAAHLHALASISRRVRHDADLGLLSAAGDADALFALLTDNELRDAA